MRREGFFWRPQPERANLVVSLSLSLSLIPPFFHPHTYAQKGLRRKEWWNKEEQINALA